MAGEQGNPTYPLWDGFESVADYAKKVNLPPTKTLDLGNNVKIEFVLIPAGKFIMGTPEPEPVDEERFHKQIQNAQILLAVSGGVLLVLLFGIIAQAIRKRQRPKYSLLWLLAMTVVAGLAVLGGVNWKKSSWELESARAEQEAAKARFILASSSEKPAHRVTLTWPFYMGKFTVTQEQYQQVIGSNPSQFKGKDNPVESVSWDDAQTFCKTLAAQIKQIVRLPSEAEWEFSCRAGTTTTFYSGDTEADLARVAWNFESSAGTTHPVGKKEPNGFGLYDMCGNVWQWCEDKFSENYLGQTEIVNPDGPIGGKNRTIRGGCWYNGSSDCRSASRGGGSLPNNRVDGIGFRVVVMPVLKK